jgi:hypothetical protein
MNKNHVILHISCTHFPLTQFLVTYTALSVLEIYCSVPVYVIFHCTCCFFYSNLYWQYIAWMCTVGLKIMCPAAFRIFFLWLCDPMRAIAFSYIRLLDHTQRRTTVGRIPLGEWSARRGDLYLTTHISGHRQTSMPRWVGTHNLSRRTAADIRLRPRAHWDRTGVRKLFEWNYLVLNGVYKISMYLFQPPVWHE